MDDLKSDKYPKTKGHLKDNDGYCCLGVLLETAGIGFNGMPLFDNLPFEGYKPNNEIYCTGNELSFYAMEVFGLSSHVHNDLIDINDKTDTFDDVVKYIEVNI